MKVWLDDERPAPRGWRRARTYCDAIALLDTNLVTEASLDHDLGVAVGVGSAHELTGYDVLLWIERHVRDRNLYRIPELHVHSANPPARKRMEAAIAAIEKAAR